MVLHSIKVGGRIIDLLVAENNLFTPQNKNFNVLLDTIVEVFEGTRIDTHIVSTYYGYFEFGYQTVEGGVVSMSNLQFYEIVGFNCKVFFNRLIDNDLEIECIKVNVQELLAVLGTRS